MYEMMLDRAGIQDNFKYSNSVLANILSQRDAARDKFERRYGECNKKNGCIQYKQRPFN